MHPFCSLPLLPTQRAAEGKGGAVDQGKDMTLHARGREGGNMLYRRQSKVRTDSRARKRERGNEEGRGQTGREIKRQGGAGRDRDSERAEKKRTTEHTQDEQAPLGPHHEHPAHHLPPPFSVLTSIVELLLPPPPSPAAPTLPRMPCAPLSNSIDATSGHPASICMARRT